MDGTGEVTQLLLNWSAGDKSALEQITQLLYRELRRLADSYLRKQRSGHTLQPTALVHEAYLKMADQTKLEFHNRNQFFGLAAQVMRNILVDHARQQNAAKRGGGVANASLDEAFASALERPSDLVALDDSLKALDKVDPRKCRIIELRYFGGLTGEEIADVIGISTATVTRELRMAQAWLHREMTTQASANP